MQRGEAQPQRLMTLGKGVGDFGDAGFCGGCSLRRKLALSARRERRLSGVCGQGILLSERGRTGEGKAGWRGGD